MSNVTVNISFQDSLLRDMDQLAQSEARSRSELVREAVRAYIRRKKRWNGIFALGREIAKKKGLKPGDVPAEIAAYRKSKATGR